MMTSKVKRWGSRYLCSYQGNTVKSHDSSRTRSIFDTKLREIPQEKRETIKSSIVSYAERIVLEGKKPM